MVIVKHYEKGNVFKTRVGGSLRYEDQVKVGPKSSYATLHDAQA